MNTRNIEIYSVGESEKIIQIYMNEENSGQSGRPVEPGGGGTLMATAVVVYTINDI
jgi:hypothetical protein